MDVCAFVAPELWCDWTSLGLHFSVSEGHGVLLVI